MRYKHGMNKPRLFWLPIVLLLCVAALADEPATLPKKARQNLQNFEFSPERNNTFQVAADAGRAYYLARSLMLDLDYQLAADPVSRGDLLGPFISLRSYADDKLKEIVMIRLRSGENGVEITIRGLYVMPGNNNMPVQSKRKPSRVVRLFPSMFEARLALFEKTQDYELRRLLDTARENLAARRDLEGTQEILEQVKNSTVAACTVGREAREMISAFAEEIDRRKTLEDAARVHQQAVDQAMADRDWPAAHRALDELLHVLHTHHVPEADPDFIAVRQKMETCRRRLRAKGVLAISETIIAPAEGNDVAVGFSVLNVGTRPIAGFKVAVNTSTAAGKPSPGRIGRGYSYSVEINPPLLPDEYYATTVVLNFEHPTDVAAADLRITSLHWGKAPNNHH